MSFPVHILTGEFDQLAFTNIMARTAKEKLDSSMPVEQFCVKFGIDPETEKQLKKLKANKNFYDGVYGDDEFEVLISAINLKRTLLQVTKQI